MKREDKILKLVNKTGYGVEIGPSYNPVAPKKAGYKVQIIDQMNREQLLAHYQGHGQPLENIEEVDYVWCFTPSSFRLLIHDLYDLGLSPFKECVFFPTVGCEFFVTLGRKGNGMHVDRLSLLKKIKAEWAS